MLILKLRIKEYKLYLFYYPEQEFGNRKLSNYNLQEIDRLHFVPLDQGCEMNSTSGYGGDNNM